MKFKWMFFPSSDTKTDMYQKEPSTDLSDAEHVDVVSCRAGSVSCIFFFFFFFFFNNPESPSSSFCCDSHCVGTVESDWGFCLDCSALGLDVRLHMPPWHQSSSWFEASRWDETHSLSFAGSSWSVSLFRFFFFFLRFFSLADSTTMSCVTVAGDATGFASPSTSEWRRFFFFFFFWLTFSAEGLLRSGSWTMELRLLEDLGLFGLGLWSPLVFGERLAFGFCSVEWRDCFWGLCCLKEPLEWTKGGDWTLGKWNGPALRREQERTSGFTLPMSFHMDKSVLFLVFSYYVSHFVPVSVRRWGKGGGIKLILMRGVTGQLAWQRGQSINVARTPVASLQLST